MVGECGGVSDAQVYRKDLFLAVQQQLQTAGEYEERRLLKRRVDSTVNLCLQQRCVSKFEDPTRIILALKTLWPCFCFCQLDVWLWDILANHQLPAGHLAHAHFLVLCLRRSCSLLPSSCHSSIGDAEDERALAVRSF